MDLYSYQERGCLGAHADGFRDALNQAHRLQRSRIRFWKSNCQYVDQDVQSSEIMSCAPCTRRSQTFSIPDKRITAGGCLCETSPSEILGSILQRPYSTCFVKFDTAKAAKNALSRC